jgi:uncharacterized RDD family membrane protein YckC
VYCVKCGTQAAEGTRFCKRCGAELRLPEQAAAGAAPQAAPAPAGYPAAASAPMPAPQAAAYPAAPAVALAPEGAPRYAGFWRRVWAALVDGIVAVLLWAVFSAGYELAAAAWLGSREFAPDGRELLGALSAISMGRSVLFAVIAFAYFALAEASPVRATLGKRLLGMRVTKLDGSRVGVVRSVARNLLKGLSAVVLMIGFAMAGFTKRKQALHDLLTRTLVVRR